MRVKKLQYIAEQTNTSGNCPNCNKVTTWNRAGFWCSMTCFYKSSMKKQSLSWSEFQKSSYTKRLKNGK